MDAAGLRATLGASLMTLGGTLEHLARFEDDMSTEWLQCCTPRPRPSQFLRGDTGLPMDARRAGYH
jgi:hypothetical protein